jgi:hypothetical protein
MPHNNVCLNVFLYAWHVQDSLSVLSYEVQQITKFSKAMNLIQSRLTCSKFWSVGVRSSLKEERDQEQEDEHDPTSSTTRKMIRLASSRDDVPEKPDAHTPVSSQMQMAVPEACSPHSPCTQRIRMGKALTQVAHTPVSSQMQMVVPEVCSPHCNTLGVIVTKNMPCHHMHCKASMIRVTTLCIN